MLDEVRPFELLKLIRDGVVTHRRDLRWPLAAKRDLRWLLATAPYPQLGQVGIARSLYETSVDYLLEALQKLEWIEISENGVIKPTERIAEVQKALGLSLTQLSSYGDDSVVANPLFGRPEEPAKPSDLFVMMPFESDLRAVYDDHIRGVTERLGISAARADDFFAANSIIADVWNAINHAKVLIADCTDHNPNVFYELGIAHTLGKPVILIAQSKGDIPFDVQHIRTIFYKFTPRGMRAFESALEATLRPLFEKVGANR